MRCWGWICEWGWLWFVSYEMEKRGNCQLNWTWFIHFLFHWSGFSIGVDSAGMLSSIAWCGLNDGSSWLRCASSVGNESLFGATTSRDPWRNQIYSYCWMDQLCDSCWPLCVLWSFGPSFNRRAWLVIPMDSCEAVDCHIWRQLTLRECCQWMTQTIMLQCNRSGWEWRPLW